MIVDAHLDLMWNTATFGRDYSLSVTEIRRREAGTYVPAVNGDATVGWPEMQKGQVGLVFSTLFGSPIRRQVAPWDTQCYGDAAQARRIYRSHLEMHYRLAERHPDKFLLVQTQTDLDAVLEHWQDPSQPSHPVGLVMLMEGAEAISDPRELEEWQQSGLRIIGPAWAGNRFCGGTGEPGALTNDGYGLLEAMAEISLILDVSHMDDKAALQALDFYPGRIIASHSNARALNKDNDTNRHLSDDVLQGIIARAGVVGVVPMNPFLLAGWRRGDRRDLVSLRLAVEQVDYICQMAGNAHQAGLGSDFDGGWGVQSAPAEINTITDLQKIASLLADKGYTEEDIAGVMGQNWIRLLRLALP